MTDMTQAPPRANRHGDPCPSWCDTDHRKVLLEATAARPAIWADVHAGTTGGFPARANARPVQVSGDPFVIADAIGMREGVLLPPRDARLLAELIDVLAGHPDELPALAAQLRESAALLEQEVTR